MKVYGSIGVALVALACAWFFLMNSGERGDGVASNDPQLSEATKAPVELAAVEPEEGTRREEAKILVDPSEDASVPSPAPAAAEEEAPKSRFKGVVVDEDTGERVPFLTLQIEQSQREEEVEVDAEGRFESTTLLEEGVVSIRIEEDASTSRFSHGFGTSMMVDHDPLDPLDHRVAIRIGPTYELDLDLPPGLARDDITVALDSDPPPNRPWDPSVREAKLRDGAQPWVRFAKPLFFEEPPPPWALTARSTKGDWSGSARVTSIAGIYPDVVKLELTTRGWVEGALTTSEGDAKNVYIVIESGGNERQLGLQQKAEYRIGWLEPGSYRLRAFSQTHEHPWVDFSVRAEKSTVIDLLMQARPIGGTLSGRVESQMGMVYSDLRVVAIPKGEKALPWTTTPVWNPTDREAKWKIEDLPAGEYTVTMVSANLPPVTPQRHETSPPDDTLVFRILDDPASALKYEVRAEDAETAKCITGPELLVRRDAADHGIRSWTSGCRIDVDQTYLAGGTLQWVLRCDGYESAWGDETAFTETSGDHTLDVVLRAGWSARFHVVDGDGAPVLGAEVSTEGVASAATDEHGNAILFSTSRPDRVSILYGDWSISSGDVLDDGSFASTGVDVEVVLEPPEAR